MFVANDKELGVRVTSLAPAWNSKFVDLRAWVTSGRLVCPGCKQKLHFRAGDERRPHFAHRVLSDCPLSKMLSPEVLESKAQLYVWLAGKYPGKVEMDVDLQIPGWDRFADLVVRPDDNKTFAYWVFDRSPRNRWGLLHGIPERVIGHVVLTESTRKMGTDDGLLLSACQRDFIGHSKYDERRGFGHLHFFDIDARKVRLYRGLHCVHEPNVYRWRVFHESPLGEYLVCERSGEIVANDDRECEESPSLCLPVREATVVESARELVEKQKIRYGDAGPVIEVSDRNRYRFPPSLRNEFYCGSDSASMNRVLKCEVCGKDTTDWVPSVLSKGACVCRGCHAQYLSASWRAKNHE